MRAATGLMKTKKWKTLKMTIYSYAVKKSHTYWSVLFRRNILIKNDSVVYFVKKLMRIFFMYKSSGINLRGPSNFHSCLFRRVHSKPQWGYQCFSIRDTFCTILEQSQHLQSSHALCLGSSDPKSTKQEISKKPFGDEVNEKGELYRWLVQGERQYWSLWNHSWGHDL